MNPLNRHGDLLKSTWKVASWAFLFKGAEQLARDYHTYSWSYISEAFSRSSRGALTDGLKHVAAKYIEPSTRYALSCSFVAACFITAYITVRSGLPSWQARKELNELSKEIAYKEDLVRQFVAEKRPLSTPKSPKPPSTLASPMAHSTPAAAVAGDVSEGTLTPSAPLTTSAYSREKLSWYTLKNKLHFGDDSLDLNLFLSLQIDLHKLYNKRLELCFQGNQKLSWDDFLNSDPTPILKAK